MDTRTSPDQKQVYLLSGIAVCADCGAPMTRKVSTVAGKNMLIIYVPQIKKQNVVPVIEYRKGSGRCRTGDAKTAYPEYPAPEKSPGIYWYCAISGDQHEEAAGQAGEEKQETERCKELRMLLYSDMKEGIVSKEDYVELHAAYGKRLRNAEESIRVIQKEMDSELKKQTMPIPG